MDGFTQVIDILLAFLSHVIEVISYDIGGFQIGMRDHLAQYDLAPVTQVGIILSVAFALILLSLRFFGGIMRFAMIVAVLLMVDRIVLPLIVN